MRSMLIEYYSAFNKTLKPLLYIYIPPKCSQRISSQNTGGWLRRSYLGSSSLTGSCDVSCSSDMYSKLDIYAICVCLTMPMPAKTVHIK